MVVAARRILNDGEGRRIKVVRRCSYLVVEEVCDGVLLKKASDLEEAGAGTICGSTLHKRRGEWLQGLYKSLKYIFRASSGPLASGGCLKCVLKVL